jgi:hypothetical protein
MLDRHELDHVELGRGGEAGGAESRASPPAKSRRRRRSWSRGPARERRRAGAQVERDLAAREAVRLVRRPSELATFGGSCKTRRDAEARAELARLDKLAGV